MVPASQRAQSPSTSVISTSAASSASSSADRAVRDAGADALRHLVAPCAGHSRDVVAKVRVEDRGRADLAPDNGVVANVRVVAELAEQRRLERLVAAHARRRPRRREGRWTAPVRWRPRARPSPVPTGCGSGSRGAGPRRRPRRRPPRLAGRGRRCVAMVRAAASRIAVRLSLWAAAPCSARSLATAAILQSAPRVAPRTAPLTTLSIAHAGADSQPPLRGPLRQSARGGWQHAARRAARAVAEGGRADLREARGEQPDGLGEGPRREVDDRDRRGGGRRSSAATRSWSRPRATPASRSR